jgi:hypothetical protein
MGVTDPNPPTIYQLNGKFYKITNDSDGKTRANIRTNIVPVLQKIYERGIEIKYSNNLSAIYNREKVYYKYRTILVPIKTESTDLSEESTTSTTQTADEYRSDDDSVIFKFYPIIASEYMNIGYRMDSSILRKAYEDVYE